jgi:ElaB/YqjD/DUF883 family membrane-anchored ribosome-binding protein
MDRESEIIHHQMEETREALTDKIESLEKQVAGTIESVTGTVEAVSETVEQVKEAFQGTVESVKESVEETVESVKETLDIGAHVRRHPWVGFGASFALGLVSGRLMQRFFPAMTDWSRAPRPTRFMPGLAAAARPAPRPPEHNGRRQEAAEQGPTHREATGQAPRRESGPSWLMGLTEMLGPEIHKLKQLAIGTALGVVRDRIRTSAPQEIGEQLAEMVNNLTVKLGGEVMHQPILETSGQPGAAAGRSR